MAEDDGGGCCFDDWARADLRRARKRKTRDRVTHALLRSLDDAGLEGRTVLDVGCGVGGLAIDTLKKGASSATGVDLGAGAIEAAATLAEEQGLTGRTRFLVADGSLDQLEPHDVVALNRVICCYPDWKGLLANTVRASRQTYAFVVPRSSGTVGVLTRAMLATGNLFFRLRRSHYGDYRAFVHDVDQLDRAVRAEGLTPVRQQSVLLVWHLAVYQR